MSSDAEDTSNSYEESDWDSEVTFQKEMAYYTLVERFTQRIAAYMMSDAVWTQLPDLIATYSWMEHNPLLRSGANYENINKLKELAGDISAQAHQRRFAISILTPGDIISLLPVILENDTIVDKVYNGYEGMLTRTQARAFYYFATMPLNIKKIFLKIPDMYRVCHEVVEEAVSDRTAVSLLKAKTVPCYLQPTLPMTMKGKQKKNRGKPAGPYKWSKKRADTLDEYP